MNIQIKMHSELDCSLKPDMVIIKQALEAMEKDSKYNRDLLKCLRNKINEYSGHTFLEEEWTQAVKNASTPEEKEKAKFEKKCAIDKTNALLDDCFDLVCMLGGKTLYRYTYDHYFNQIVAGLMGSTCYMKDTFADLENKRIKDIRVIAKTVENNGHHSTFGHSHLTLEITGIPKLLAMILNNEQEYNTSEKSARYTQMDDIAEDESELFHKWKAIFEKEIARRYATKQPFFDAKGVKISKLAQENARYMISSYTPTNMVYTTSFRQFNYICHWFEDVIASNNPNEVYAQLIPYMSEFVQWFKDNGLYGENLADGKDRKLSFFGEPLIKETRNSDVFAIKNELSVAALAQSHRHRTNHHHISEFEFFNRERKYFVPPIIKGTDLEPQWLADIKSVEKAFPQGTLLPVVEKGTTSNYLMKAKERVCVLAQKEIRDMTQEQCKEFAKALESEIQQLDKEMFTKDPVMLQLLMAKKASVQAMLDKFSKMSKTARCTAGYHCTSPCKFGEGVSLTSLV
ncbi:MAG: FAD-dependent thymidylate synthase [Clostridia bacterium]|nr:FAD-dependent thymidylate synthase [Clostridia bacterium]